MCIAIVNLLGIFSVTTPIKNQQTFKKLKAC